MGKILILLNYTWLRCNEIAVMQFDISEQMSRNTRTKQNNKTWLSWTASTKNITYTVLTALAKQ